MKIKLKWPFEFEGVHYESITVPDCIQLGHRRLQAKSKGLDAEEAGIVFCAALCEIPDKAFDRLSLDDFELVTDAVQRLFNSASQKKQTSPMRSETSPES
jgi:hypothetical protein